MLRRALILGGLCVLVAAVGSVSWAMTSASDKFVACAAKKSGALRLVEAAKNCKKTERAVTWNIAGERGPAGARGLAGEDGADGLDGLDGDDGDDGDDGVDGLDGDDGTDATVTWKFVTTDNVAVAANGTNTVSAGTCAGTTTTPNAVNGGVELASLPAAVSVTATGRGTAASVWDVQLANTGTAATTVSTWVLCTNGTILP